MLFTLTDLFKRSIALQTNVVQLSPVAAFNPGRLCLLEIDKSFFRACVCACGGGGGGGREKFKLTIIL